MKGSLVLAGCFAAGVLCGATGVLPPGLLEGRATRWVLCALMCCVGLGVGSRPGAWRSFRSVNPRLAWLPVATVAGTLAAAAAASLLPGLPPATDCLAVGSGFAYYSLSSVFITEYKGAELGTVALLANVLRELFTLLFAPLMVRWFGALAPVAAGGATTMDTTLPVILRCSGQSMAPVSLFHGFVVDFSVPFLVTLFCSL